VWSITMRPEKSVLARVGALDLVLDLKRRRAGFVAVELTLRRSGITVSMNQAYRSSVTNQISPMWLEKG